MKMRRIAGAALIALGVAACGGSAVEPEPAAAAGAVLDRKPYPPGLIGNPSPVADTGNIHNGYFGSGHRRQEPPTDTVIVIIPR
jgi:hypothetical protein